MAGVLAPLVFQQLDAFGQEAVETIRKDILTKNVAGYGPMNASGRAARSLRYYIIGRESGLTLVIAGIDYSYHLEYGRGPGKFPNVASLRTWVRRKFKITGTDAKTQRKVKSIAYLIGRKIAQEGTILHKAAQPSGILSKATGSVALQQLKKRLGPALVERTAGALREMASPEGLRLRL
ncbi:hypothetical protein [Hymenobacter fodinae]|uniref:HK97 gp10 family phage protein n=1 Tax=Hymenobacter fodinae TaxID=2510796 RepID=A0A4Z0P9A2_9BACT|nr:hypothetical protein [Hymenobacter fodinae]TGE08759.1 hypothetical protein EU556_13820 [Hymenobacter fodinae]